MHDTKAGVVKFFVTYPRGNNDSNTILKYFLATLKNDVMTVSGDAKDIFAVNNPLKESCTMQDIFYDPQYGFFIPIWYNLSKDDKHRNRILVVDINPWKTNKENKTLTFSPKTVVKINGNKNYYGQYEIESMGIVYKDKNLKNSSPKIVFSCNTGKGDRIDMITNSSELISGIGLRDGLDKSVSCQGHSREEVSLARYVKSKF